MSKREIAVLAVRIISIQLFLTSLSVFERFIGVSVQVFDFIRTATPTSFWSVYSPMGRIEKGNMWLMLSANLVIVSLWFVVAGCLWLGAPRLSRSLVEEYAGDPPLDTRGLDVPRLALSLLGVYLLAGIVPNLLGNVVNWTWNQLRWTFTANPGFMRSPFNGYEVIRLLVALWLTFGTRGIVGIIYKAREWATQGRAPKTSPGPLRVSEDHRDQRP